MALVGKQPPHRPEQVTKSEPDSGRPHRTSPNGLLRVMTRRVRVRGPGEVMILHWSPRPIPSLDSDMETLPAARPARRARALLRY
jgi:hypothetical protein